MLYFIIRKNTGVSRKDFQRGHRQIDGADRRCRSQDGRYNGKVQVLREL